MIKSLKIQNFQSHKNSSLEFHNGLNVIIGKSDSGKTAIFRAIHWVANNRPSGETCRSSWGGETKVEWEGGNLSVSRTKDKAHNSYLIEGASQKNQKFTAFGTDVPEEVKNALRIGEINLQGQFDRPFLLERSSGEIAKHFNRLAHIERIDLSLSNVNSWISAITRQIEKNKENKERAEEQLAELPDLEKMEAEIEVLEENERRLFLLRTNRTKLYKLVTKIKEADDELKEKQLILPMEEILDAIISLYDQKQRVEIKVSHLTKLVKAISQTKQFLRKHQAVLLMEKDLNGIVDRIQKTQDLQAKKRGLSNLVQAIFSTKLQMLNKVKILKKAEQILADNYPDECPFCGQKIPHYEKN